LYFRLGSHLATALDRELRLRAQDLSVVVSRPGPSLAGDTKASLVERGESYAQLLDENGRVVDATRPLGAGSLLSPAEIRRALRGSYYAGRPRVPGLDEPSRLLTTAVTRDGKPLVLGVGAKKQGRAEALASFRYQLL